MSDDADSGGLVSQSDLKNLAELFDAAENALEPDSREARSAQVEFDRAVEILYDENIAPNPTFACVAQPVFKAKLRTLCRLFLRKN